MADRASDAVSACWATRRRRWRDSPRGRTRAGSRMPAARRLQNRRCQDHPHYRLPARHVIHTVGPAWRRSGRSGIVGLLSCYRRSIEVAAQRGLRTLAFPAISTGNLRLSVRCGCLRRRCNGARNGAWPSGHRSGDLLLLFRRRSCDPPRAADGVETGSRVRVFARAGSFGRRDADTNSFASRLPAMHSLWHAHRSIDPIKRRAT